MSNTASLIHTSKTTWTPCANTPLAYSDPVVDIPAEAVDEAFVGTAGQLINPAGLGDAGKAGPQPRGGIAGSVRTLRQIVLSEQSKVLQE